MEKYTNTIKTIIVTLDGVKAEGADNWNRLLACEQKLREMLADMQKEEPKE